MALTRVRWGDGATSTGGRSSTHVYRRARSYTITVTGTDRAGNRTVVTRTLRIARAAAARVKSRRRTATRHRVPVRKARR
jgi:hypothetical protein